MTPTITQPLNNPVWNYLYAGHTGSACDQSLPNNITGSSRMYVAGNLCLSQNVNLAESTVIVGGNVDVANNASVGASTNLSTRVETFIGGNCRYTTSGSWTACSGNQDANHIYSKLSDGTTIGVNHTPPVVAPPAADYATWYENAIPGPSQTCTSSSGTPPTFDGNYPSRDGSVSTVFDLTPSSSYFCRVGHGRQHDAGERDDRLADDAERRRRDDRLPEQPVQHQDRRRVHDGDGRLRHDDLDRRSRRQGVDRRRAREQPDRRVGHGSER